MINNEKITQNIKLPDQTNPPEPKNRRNKWIIITVLIFIFALVAFAIYGFNTKPKKTMVIENRSVEELLMNPHGEYADYVIENFSLNEDVASVVEVYVPRKDNTKQTQKVINFNNIELEAPFGWILLATGRSDGILGNSDGTIRIELSAVDILSKNFDEFKKILTPTWLKERYVAWGIDAQDIAIFELGDGNIAETYEFFEDGINYKIMQVYVPNETTGFAWLFTYISPKEKFYKYANMFGLMYQDLRIQFPITRDKPRTTFTGEPGEGVGLSEEEKDKIIEAIVSSVADIFRSEDAEKIQHFLDTVYKMKVSKTEALSKAKTLSDNPDFLHTMEEYLRGYGTSYVVNSPNNIHATTEEGIVYKLVKINGKWILEL